MEVLVIEGIKKIDGETKVAAVHQAAEGRGYPLRAGLEKE